MIDFRDPFTLLCIVPAMISIVGAGMIWLAENDRRGQIMASSATGLAVLISITVYYGSPAIEKATVIDQIFWLGFCGLVYGSLRDYLPGRYIPHNLILIFLALLAAVLPVISSPAFISDIEGHRFVSETTITALFIMALSVGILQKIERDQDQGVNMPLIIFAYSLGLYLLSWIGDIPLSFNIGLIVLSALGGFMVLNLVLNFTQWHFPASMAMILSIYLVLLTTTTHLFGIAPEMNWAILLLVSIIYMNDLLEMLPAKITRPALFHNSPVLLQIIWLSIWLGFTAAVAIYAT